jgi:hypothetical protein
VVAKAQTFAERSTLDRASAMSPFYLGRRLILFVGHKKYPKVAVDRAAISVSRDITFLQAARQLNLVVELNRSVVVTSLLNQSQPRR